MIIKVYPSPKKEKKNRKKKFTPPKKEQKNRSNEGEGSIMLRDSWTA